jgi:hypothetical protein
MAIAMPPQNPTELQSFTPFISQRLESGTIFLAYLGVVLLRQKIGYGKKSLLFTGHGAHARPMLNLA